MDEHNDDESFDLSGLNDLIIKYFQHFNKQIDDKAKIGDLIKLIELKRKLAPENSEQKKFWKMINKIRKENLQSKNDTNQKKKITKTNEI